MKMSAGQHRGTPIEMLVIKNPDYIFSMFSPGPETERLNAERAEALRLIQKFEEKPFIDICYHADCSNRASRLSAYPKGSLMLPWCDSCDPHWFGASRGKLSFVKTIQDIKDHVTISEETQSYFKYLVDYFARLKGLPAQFGPTEALAFFEE